MSPAVSTATSWLPAFAIIITTDALAGLLAFFALQPLRKRYAAA
jgi:hypothetical protein